MDGKSGDASACRFDWDFFIQPFLRTRSPRKSGNAGNARFYSRAWSSVSNGFYLARAIWYKTRRQLGLIYASVGFIVAFLIGIPIARSALRRGLNESNDVSLNEALITGFHNSKEGPLLGKEVTPFL